MCECSQHGVSYSMTWQSMVWVTAWRVSVHNISVSYSMTWQSMVWVTAWCVGVHNVGVSYRMTWQSMVWVTAWRVGVHNIGVSYSMTWQLIVWVTTWIEESPSSERWNEALVNCSITELIVRGIGWVLTRAAMIAGHSHAHRKYKSTLNNGHLSCLTRAPVLVIIAFHGCTGLSSGKLIRGGRLGSDTTPHINLGERATWLPEADTFSPCKLI
jgi:hypothetical protein